MDFLAKKFFLRHLLLKNGQFRARKLAFRVKNGFKFFFSCRCVSALVGAERPETHPILFNNSYRASRYVVRDSSEPSAWETAALTLLLTCFRRTSAR